MSGLELQERLIAENSLLPIIFVTGHGDVPMAVSTMKKGAMDFIEKPFDEAELRKLVERMLDKARSESTSVQQQRAAAERLGKLTAREHQVLERIIAGRLNKQIADDLGISIKTVEAHRANIMEKLTVNTVADLLRLALVQQAADAAGSVRFQRLLAGTPRGGFSLPSAGGCFASRPQLTTARFPGSATLRAGNRLTTRTDHRSRHIALRVPRRRKSPSGSNRRPDRNAAPHWRNRPPATLRPQEKQRIFLRPDLL